MAEISLAKHIPLWQSFRQDGVTCLLTPSLDYVAALALGTLDGRYASDEAIAGLGEGLRQLLTTLEDGTVLHFLFRSELGAAEEDIREYERLCAPNGTPALAAYVAGRASWLRQQPLRKTRLFLFLSKISVTRRLELGFLGMPLEYKKTRLTEAEHQARVKALGEFRDRVVARLNVAGLRARELTLDEVWRLHFQLLNPNRSKKHIPPRPPQLDNLLDDATVKQLGNHIAEYTEAEQLFNEDLERERGHLRQGDTFRRVLTLKSLPEGGSDYCGLETLLEDLNESGTPFPYTLAVTVAIRHQGAARWALNQRHKLVSQVQKLMQRFSSDQDVAEEQATRSQQDSIASLFAELSESSTKIAELSTSILLDAPSLEVLSRRTEAARLAFGRIGNTQVQDETWTQLQAFLAVLPTSGPYQFRRKGCTSHNAADQLPVIGPWTGTTRAASILQTPSGDLFRFDPFDKKIVNAHHGIVVADTGSGKSFTMGAILLDALGSGVEAVLVDNGWSWKPLTDLLGGVHVPVDLSTSISPFVSYAEMLDPATREISNEELETAVNFIEVCVQDRTRLPFDKVEKDAVSKAIRWCYETRFRERPEHRPLIGDFAEALRAFHWTHPDDKRIAEDLCRRLEIFTTGIYRDLLNKPSNLKFDVPLLTFEMSKVAENPTTRAIAMATMIQAISNRAQRRQRATIVAIDEAHEYIGGDEATGAFLGRSWRKMRKFGTAMYAITQKLPDFLANHNAREAILGNSTLRYFLRHMKGNHGPVINHFQLPPRAARAFEGLSMKPGHYSDLMLMYGPHTSVLRLAVTPLAYWILTTDKTDKDLLARAREKNPLLDPLSILQELAARYPNGVVGASN